MAFTARILAALVMAGALLPVFTGAFSGKALWVYFAWFFTGFQGAFFLWVGAAVLDYVERPMTQAVPAAGARVVFSDAPFDRRRP